MESRNLGMKKAAASCRGNFSERRKKKKKYIGIFFDVFVQKREIGSLPLLNRNSGRAADLLWKCFIRLSDTIIHDSAYGMMTKFEREFK